MDFRLPGDFQRGHEHIGHHILKRRRDLGLQQKQAARQIGVHAGSLENWEYGRTKPVEQLMPAVIRFLGYNPLPSPATPGERVAYERVTRGWSRKRLAASAGVDEATVRRIEEDVPQLTQRSLQAVSRALRRAEKI